MEALDKYEAWELVKVHDGRKPASSKWVFKKKQNALGKVKKYKS